MTSSVAPSPDDSDEPDARLGREARRLAASSVGRSAAQAPDEVAVQALTWAAGVGPGLPLPGGGRTHELWRTLAAVGAADLGVARVVEPHLDALAILAQAGPVDPGLAPPEATYGVWAAEGGGNRLEARTAPDGTWTLVGRKPWCSLAGVVSHALVTAWVDDHRRGLFVLAARDPRVRVEPGTWSTLGLADVVTSTIEVDHVEARPVGGPGWYLSRDGFAWGGIGVAAVWFGGAVSIARRLRAQATRREPDQVGLMHLGAVDVALSTARAALDSAASQVDAGLATGAQGQLAAARVRQVVADAVEVVTARAGHALGPAPLAHEPEHARRVADLTLYVRQHHAERDQAALGRLVLDTGADW